MFDMLPKTVLGPHQLRGATINRNSPQAAGIVGAWQPNVFPGGNVLYDRAGGFNGTITGADWATDATLGHALNFVAANSDYVDAGDIADFTANFTLMAWLVPDDVATSSYPAIIARRIDNTEYQYHLRVRGSALSLLCTSGAVNGAITLSNGVLVHVAATHDGTTARLYVDGIADNSGNITCTNKDTTLRIGGILIGAGGYFDGRIGDVRIYNRALSAAEIAAIYADPLGLWQPTLQIPMDDDYAAAGNPWWYYNLLSRRRAG